MTPFKSITGRALGKLLEGYKSSDIGKGFGGGGLSIQAVGGDTVKAGGYTYHIFTDNGSFQVIDPSFDKVINYVVVAGGGGGGSGNTGNGSNHYSGSGAGAGGVRIGTASISGEGTYTVTVGNGGNGNNTSPGGPTPGFGTQGSPSTFALPTTVFATGGGAGENRNARSNGGKSNSDASYYMPGGSGGGSATGGSPVGPALASPDGISPTVQGYPGGLSSGPGESAGGGGGASAAGSDVPNYRNGGPGGNGVNTVFPGPGIYPGLPAGTRTTIGTAWRDALGPNGTVGGGGGGAQGSSNFQSRGTGGSGGGGNASPTNTGAGENGVICTGGGGGGGADQSYQGGNSVKGGNGGKGIVMIRYPS